MEVRHDRRRGFVDGALRHAGGLLRGHNLTGSAALSGLNWSVLAQHSAELDKTSMRLAFVLILMGYGTKLASRRCTPGNPTHTARPLCPRRLLSTSTLNCAFYGLIRFYILTSGCLGAEYPSHLLLLFGLLSMGVAVPFVLVQKNFRRLLAYSTIDHAGIMAIALESRRAWQPGLMLHMTFHTIAKALLFLCAGNVYQHFKTDQFSKIKGSVIKAMPLTGVVFFVRCWRLSACRVQPVSERVPHFARGLRWRHTLTGVLFVVFSAGVFAGVLLLVGGMILARRR